MCIKRTSYKTYTKEFKLEAIRLMSGSDKPSAEIAAELGIRRSMLYKWKEQLESKVDEAFPIREGRPIKENQSEVLTLKQDNRRLRKEVNILKKAAVHSDQGITYASNEYLRLLKKHNIQCSMSRKGECHENAVAESFFSSLKAEWVDDEDYFTRSEAKESIFEYIEIFYNRQQRHSYLGHVSPVEYEQANAF